MPLVLPPPHLTDVTSWGQVTRGSPSPSPAINTARHTSPTQILGFLHPPAQLPRCEGKETHSLA